MPRKERRPDRKTKRNHGTRGEGKRPKDRLDQDDFSRAELDRQRSLLFGLQPPNIASRRLRALSQVRELGGDTTGDTVSGASNWVIMGPQAIPNGQTSGGARVLVTGRISGIAIHPTTPSTMYIAGARGGVWKTSNGGQTWAPVSDNQSSLAIGAIALAPSSPDTLYAGTGEGNIYYLTAFLPLNALNDSYEGSGILMSINGGSSWVLQATAELTGAAIYKIAVHPTNSAIAFAATSRGLYRTLNGGANWAQVAGGLPAISGTVIACTDVTIDPTNGDRAWTGFWGSGIYECSNATAVASNWTAVTGNPAASVGRISLAVAPSSPTTIYALCATSTGGYKGVYSTAAGIGGSWSPITYTGTTPAVTTSKCCLAIDISTPDIVYLGGTSLHKLVRNAITNTWSATDIGSNIHPDNRTIATHPTAALTIFAGTDGGIYQTPDGGGSWSDAINKRFAITQFEFMDHHPTLDAVVFAGTQDNGTEQYRTSEVFYHADDGDGGAVAIDIGVPNNVINEHFSISPQRSTQAGKFGTFNSIAAGIAGSSLFYPPLALDATNSANIAFGTDRICLDSAEGTGGWGTQISLPGITGLVSTINYVNSSLIYAATTAGEVYRAVKSAGVWSATAIHAAPLPSRWIWHVSVSPTDSNTITAGLGGFGTAHVWRGVVNLAGTAAVWSDVSGTAPQRLADAPVNSLAIDPSNPLTIYAGTDVGVFVTTDDGGHWIDFRQGLPNTAIYDLKIHGPSRLLRAATHGRGMWERQLDVTTSNDTVIYVRDNIMHTGRGSAPYNVPAAFEDLLEHVLLGDPVFWWQCADAKIDALEGMPPSYQMPISAVDFVTFEAQLSHRDPQRGRVNNVYVTAHNRGITAGDVTVKILYADATTSLPDLPADFWAAFPNDPVAPANGWTPIGTALTLQVVPGIPTVFSWTWTPPGVAAAHSCLLVVCDCAQDPTPPAGKVFGIGALVSSERRVGLKNLHVVDPPPADQGGDLVVFPFAVRAERAGDVLRILPRRLSGWSIGLILPAALDTPKIIAGRRVRISKRLFREIARHTHPRFASKARMLKFESRDLPAEISPLGASKKAGQAFLVLGRGTRAARGSISIVQERDGKVIGGNTFVIASERPLEGDERRT